MMSRTWVLIYIESGLKTSPESYSVDYIPCKIIRTYCNAGIAVEINLRKKKRLVCYSYHPHKSNIANHLKSICKTVEKLSATYDNLILLGDFNVELRRKVLLNFQISTF